MSDDLDAWTDELHAAFLALVGLFNRPEPDAMLLAAAGVKLDRALLPLLSRIGLSAPVSVVELGHLTSKDHSTVSRQVAKLEELGLISRQASPADQRVRLLVPSERGAEILAQLRVARRRAIRQAMSEWSAKDRADLLRLVRRVVDEAEAATGARGA
jgi:DNA-binding MarR family transcriptional regulator